MDTNDDNTNDSHQGENADVAKRKKRKQVVVELGVPVKRTRVVDYDDNLGEGYSDFCTEERSEDEEWDWQGR